MRWRDFSTLLVVAALLVVALWCVRLYAGGAL